MNRTENTIFDDSWQNQYQMILRELKNNNSNLQEKFEKLSKVVEDEWKDMGTANEYSYELTSDLRG